MKKLILTLTASLACVAAFAQGKISFQTDSLHLAYYGGVKASDSALAGTGVDSANMPGGVTLVADLYVGTSSTALSLISSTGFGGTPGKWSAVSALVPGVAGGTAVFVVAQVRDNSVPAESVFVPGVTSGILVGGQYWGASAEFSFTLGPSVTYPPMYSQTSGNWPVGSFDMGGGNKGAIAVSAVPEPASFALVGLGIAAMTIFRRRK